MRTAPVYRALLPRDLMAGIPRPLVLILVACSTVVVGGFSQYWFLAVSGFLYVFMRILTRHDPYLIETGLLMIAEPNRLEV